MANEKQNRWLTPNDLEKEYGFKESTMSKYRMNKKISFTKIGSKFIRYDRYKIDKWLEINEVIGE